MGSIVTMAKTFKICLKCGLRLKHKVETKKCSCLNPIRAEVIEAKG